MYFSTYYFFFHRLSKITLMHSWTMKYFFPVMKQYLLKHLVTHLDNFYHLFAITIFITLLHLNTY